MVQQNIQIKNQKLNFYFSEPPPIPTKPRKNGTYSKINETQISHTFLSLEPANELVPFSNNQSQRAPSPSRKLEIHLPRDQNSSKSPASSLKRPSLHVDLERKVFDYNHQSISVPTAENKDIRRNSETPSIVLSPAVSSSNFLELPKSSSDEDSDKDEKPSQSRKSSLSVSSAKSRSRSASISSRGRSTDSEKSKSSDASEISTTKIGRERKRQKSAYSASHSANGLDPSFSGMMNSPFLDSRSSHRKGDRKKNESEASNFRRKKSHER